MGGICIVTLASGVMGIGQGNAGEKRMWWVANVRPQIGGEKRKMFSQSGDSPSHGSLFPFCCRTGITIGSSLHSVLSKSVSAPAGSKALG